MMTVFTERHPSGEAGADGGGTKFTTDDSAFVAPYGSEIDVERRCDFAAGTAVYLPSKIKRLK